MLPLRNLALATPRAIYRSFSQTTVFRVMAEKQLFLAIFKNRFVNSRDFNGISDVRREVAWNVSIKL